MAAGATAAASATSIDENTRPGGAIVAQVNIARRFG
jgi:hypothetical protein